MLLACDRALLRVHHLFFLAGILDGEHKANH